MTDRARPAAPSNPDAPTPPDGPRADAPAPGASRPSGALRTFSRSTLVSIFTTALDFGTLVGLVELLGMGYVPATWAGTVVGSLSNFLVNRHWAFEAGESRLGTQVWRFLLVQAGASALHTLGVWLFTRYGGLPYVVSKTVVAALVFVAWNYPLNRAFVFRRAPAEGAAEGPA